MPAAMPSKRDSAHELYEAYFLMNFVQLPPEKQLEHFYLRRIVPVPPEAHYQAVTLDTYYNHLIINPIYQLFVCIGLYSFASGCIRLSCYPCWQIYTASVANAMNAATAGNRVCLASVFRLPFWAICMQTPHAKAFATARIGKACAAVAAFCSKRQIYWKTRGNCRSPSR
ncbi:hypothetical protein [Kingella sp. (in: b-proteobacteria)]|uniref:hypothetical protein n=1 Tax=Kingella sp. (in: b-proteobacteria) TaxID=2020713 RepID=UPI0026DB7532|nr:hypothetical protein [Kingella sp. (in: b-proteobacteria)]MDO4658520.1 hypothetical protein [Kingella sp. (in: b-proteobacteria)]